MYRFILLGISIYLVLAVYSIFFLSAPFHSVSNFTYEVFTQEASLPMIIVKSPQVECVADFSSPEGSPKVVAQYIFGLLKDHKCVLFPGAKKDINGQYAYSILQLSGGYLIATFDERPQLAFVPNPIESSDIRMLADQKVEKAISSQGTFFVAKGSTQSEDVSLSLYDGNGEVVMSNFYRGDAEVLVDSINNGFVLIDGSKGVSDHRVDFVYSFLSLDLLQLKEIGRMTDEVDRLDKGCGENTIQSSPGYVTIQGCVVPLGHEGALVLRIPQ